MGWMLKSWRRRAAKEGPGDGGSQPARAGFVGDRRGSTAIEFAILALPFSILLFTTIENSIAFTAQEVMATATYDISRQILTGKLRPADVDETKLKTMLCQRMSVLAPSSCTSDIVVDLRAYPTFADAATQRIKINGGELDTTGFKVEVGGAGTKSMLRVFYKWPLLSNYATGVISTPLNGGRMLHFASEVWQNEPFPD